MVLVSRLWLARCGGPVVVGLVGGWQASDLVSRSSWARARGPELVGLVGGWQASDLVSRSSWARSVVGRPRIWYPRPRGPDKERAEGDSASTDGRGPGPTSEDGDPDGGRDGDAAAAFLSAYPWASLRSVENTCRFSRVQQATTRSPCTSYPAAALLSAASPRRCKACRSASGAPSLGTSTSFPICDRWMRYAGVWRDRAHI